MKAKKAIKRLAKIEALLSDVTKRFPNTSLQIQGALKDAKAVFARVKEAVSLQVLSEAANDSKAHSKATPEPAKRKLSAAGEGATQEGVHGRMAKKNEATPNTAPSKKKVAAKTMAAKTPAAMTARKRAQINKAAKKDATPKETPQAPVEIPATVETTPSTLATASATLEATPATLETPPAAVEIPTTLETAPVTVETTPATVGTAPADVEAQTEPVAQMSVGQ